VHPSLIYYTWIRPQPASQPLVLGQGRARIDTARFEKIMEQVRLSALADAEPESRDSPKVPRVRSLLLAEDIARVRMEIEAAGIALSQPAIAQPCQPMLNPASVRIHQPYPLIR
jgi:hypothetical protein